MRTPNRLIALLLLAVATTTGAAEEHGVVTVAYDGKTQDVHPVAIIEVDGKLQPTPLRETLFLAPGKHTLRLAVQVTDAKLLIRGNNQSNRNKHAGVLEIEVEAGKRYHIGGKLKGYRTSDWEPVVLRVEDVRG